MAGEPRPAGHRREAVELPPTDATARVRELLDEGLRLALVAGRDDGDAIHVVWLLTAGPPDRRVEVRTRLDRDTPAVPSLAARSFPAGRFERELHDLLGVEPVGHPLPRRLVLHQHWPEGWYPMRADAGPVPPMTDEGNPFPFLTVEGPGVYEIPVGPVHAGLIEPGHFRFSVVGETILNVKARLWFVHRGVERLFEGRDPLAGVELAERVSGDTAVGHNLAYCLAVEDALGCVVPPEAATLRATLLELERLYNHVADIGALCNDVGFGVVHAHAQRIRERLLRLNASVTGHRLLRGGIVPGGASVHRLPSVDELAEIAGDVGEVVGIALANTTVVDRFTGTAVLDGRAARDLGVLGYVARASGLDLDARVAHPFADLGVDLTGRAGSTGDVLARFQARVTEFAASIALLRALIARAEAGSFVARAGEGRPGASGVGIVEGWRGTIVHRAELGAGGALARVKVVDPSWFNWPALPIALTDTIVPDFPLANKSFNLSYAGNDL